MISRGLRPDAVAAPRLNLAEAPAGRPAPGLPRADALDALRGLAFLGVVFAAAEPYGVLPAWMYHAQNPPPTHAVDFAVAGLTFVDLVFPFFLFAMGAAIPLALARRLEKGGGLGGILRHAVTRWWLLMFLALFRAHFDSGAGPAVHEPESYAWLLGLIGFAVLFAIFTRLPDAWPRARRLGIRAAGWIGAVLMFVFARFPDGDALRPHQTDIILVIIAYGVALSTCVWLLTRRHLHARLAILAAVAAVRLNNGHDGWIGALYGFRPFDGWYEFGILEYLCVAIPGTIAGDLIVSWARSPSFDATRHSMFDASDLPRVPFWSLRRAAAVAGLSVACVPLLLVGVQSRLVLLTTIAAAVLCGAAIAISRRAESSTDVLVAQLVRWGAVWTMLGLLLDPAEGGTHKLPPTFAWYFQGAGLATLVLAAFVVLIHTCQRRRAAQLLIDNGQNPMLGYVVFGMVLQPVLGLSGIKEAVEGVVEPHRWIHLVWSLVLTAAVAYVVSFFSRRRVYWRS